MLIRKKPTIQSNAEKTKKYISNQFNETLSHSDQKKNPRKTTMIVSSSSNDSFQRCEVRE